MWIPALFLLNSECPPLDIVKPKFAWYGFYDRCSIPILIIASNSHRNTLPSSGMFPHKWIHTALHTFWHHSTYLDMCIYIYVKLYIYYTQIKIYTPILYIYIDIDRSANIDLQSSADYLHRLLLHAAKPIPFQLLLCEDIAALFNQVPRFLLFCGLGECGVCVSHPPHLAAARQCQKHRPSDRDRAIEIDIEIKIDWKYGRLAHNPKKGHRNRAASEMIMATWVSRKPKTMKSGLSCEASQGRKTMGKSMGV